MTTLLKELRSEPPQWILYQRQPAVLQMHEVFYNRGHPLPQRALDEEFMTRIRSGQWHKVFEWNSKPDPKSRSDDDNANWILIRTN